MNQGSTRIAQRSRERGRGHTLPACVRTTRLGHNGQKAKKSSRFFRRAGTNVWIRNIGQAKTRGSEAVSMFRLLWAGTDHFVRFSEQKSAAAPPEDKTNARRRRHRTHSARVNTSRTHTLASLPHNTHARSGSIRSSSARSLTRFGRHDTHRGALRRGVETRRELLLLFLFPQYYRRHARSSLTCRLVANNAPISELSKKHLSLSCLA